MFELAIWSSRTAKGEISRVIENDPEMGRITAVFKRCQPGSCWPVLIML